MSRDILSAALTINNRLKPTERLLNNAALDAAGLLHTMLDHHQRCGVSDEIGMRAIGHAARAAMLAVEAREAAFRAHTALNHDLRKVGLSEMLGKDGPAPGNGPGTTEAMPFFTTGAARDEALAAE